MHRSESIRVKCVRIALTEKNDRKTAAESLQGSKRIAVPATPHYQAYQTMPSPLDALLKEPFLLREDNSGTKQETLYFLKNKGLSLDDLNVIAVMDDATALKQCIMLGMGISILSKATVQADARQGKLLLFPLGEAAFLRKLYLVYSPVKYMAEEGGVFLEFAKRFYQL